MTLCAATAVLAFPASAAAETIKHKGEIVGDSETRVSLKVEYNSLGPISVDDFKAKNVFTRCDKKPSRLDFTALDPIDVKSDNSFKARLTDNEGGFLRIQGKVKNGGETVVGNLKTNEIRSEDGSLCKTPKQKFKTFAK
jgi:hypothetical protein